MEGCDWNHTPLCGRVIAECRVIATRGEMLSKNDPTMKKPGPYSVRALSR